MNSKRLSLHKLVFFFFIFLTVFIFNRARNDSHAQESPLRVHFLDVGYGDAILIELPGQYVMMIDAGQAVYGPALLKYLQSLNVHAVDAVIITHPHKNHFGGFHKIAQSIPIKRAYINGDQRSEEGYADLMRLFHEKNIIVTTLRRGDMLQHLPAGMEAEVLHPNDLSRSPNDNSIVVLLEYLQTSVLFMGDVERGAQRNILNAYKDLKSVDVVQVPHHGGPLSGAFIKTFEGKTFVMSTGPNRWGQPREDQLEKLNGDIYRTDHYGAIIVESNGRSISVKHSF